MGPVRDLNPNGWLPPTISPSALTKKAPLFLDAIRFQESVFALPFAYTGMVLAADGLPTLPQFVWITLAMVSARTVGMSANRIIDRHIDAINPRTAERHLPRGVLRVADLFTPAMLSLAVFFVAALMLNPLALALAPLAAAYLVLYPYAKRYTWTANLMLGGALGMAPSAAWIGVTGTVSWEPVVLSLSVALWASSFDILYHAQDHRFYVDQGLHSVARRFGIAGAFWWARVLDALALTSLMALGIGMGLDWPYYVGWAIAAGLLVYKHRLIRRGDVSSIGAAFFKTNAYLSITVFVATLTALLIR